MSPVGTYPRLLSPVHDLLYRLLPPAAISPHSFRPRFHGPDPTYTAYTKRPKLPHRPPLFSLMALLPLKSILVLTCYSIRSHPLRPRTLSYRRSAPTSPHHRSCRGPRRAIPWNYPLTPGSPLPVKPISHANKSAYATGPPAYTAPTLPTQPQSPVSCYDTLPISRRCTSQPSTPTTQLPFIKRTPHVLPLPPAATYRLPPRSACTLILISASPPHLPLPSPSSPASSPDRAISASPA